MMSWGTYPLLYINENGGLAGNKATLYKQAGSPWLRSWQRPCASELKGDREIVLAAVKQEGFGVRFSAEKLKGDRYIVFGAVQRKGRTWRSATEDLGGGRVLILTAVRRKALARGFATEELRSDREIVLASVRGCTRKGGRHRRAQGRPWDRPRHFLG
jgi:hypothetical protein